MVSQKQKVEVQSKAKTEAKSSTQTQSNIQAKTATQSTTQSQTQSKTESKAKVESKTEAKAESKVETKTEANTSSQSSSQASANIYTEIEALSDDQMMTDNEAMIGFSQAIQSGINVMDLPDPSQKKEETPQLNDVNSMFVFQEHVNKISDVTDDPPPVLEEEVHTKPVEQVSITSIAAQMAQDQAEGKVEPQPTNDDDQPPPSESQMQAQSALDEVKIVLPEGMDVQDHKKPVVQKQEEEDPDAIIKAMQEQNEANHYKDPRKAIPLTQIQSEAQAAMEIVQVKDPFAEEEKEEKHNHLVHIFESNLPSSESKGEVSDDINVYQATTGTVSLNASKLDGITSDDKTSILEIKQKKDDMEKAIKVQEQQQSNQEQLETDIAQTNDLWGTQFDMDHISTKLAVPSNVKTLSQIELDKKKQEKAERQKIRLEILAPSLISDDDARLFSDSLATKSDNSKSESQLAEEKVRAQENKAKQDEIDRQKLAQIQAQNKRLQEQMQQQEQAQIKQAELKRIERKNNEDLKSLQELKSLNNIQTANTGSGIAQLNSLADQAAIDESVRQDEAQIQQSAEAISQVAQQEFAQNSIPQQLAKPARLPPPIPKIQNLQTQKLGVNVGKKIKAVGRTRH